MPDLNQSFAKAQDLLKHLKEDPGNDAKLKIYALFKQSTVGKNNSKRPGLTDFVGRAKWDAWNALGSMLQDEAKQKYIDYVSELTGMSVAPGEVDTRFEGLEAERDGKLMIIRFNVPKRRNAITPPMYHGLTELLKEAADNPDISIVAITGNGAFYSSGNDFGYLLKQSAEIEIENVGTKGMDVVRNFIDILIDFPKPLVAVVNGPAVGVAVTTLALMDVVYAVDNAWLHCPFTSLGLCPEGCSSVTFPAIMGHLKASELLLFNKKITTSEAHTLGLVTQVYPEATFQSEVWPKLKQMSELPFPSLMAGKKLTRGAQREILHNANQQECDYLKNLSRTDETISALLNFFSKKSKL